jgi:dTDP-4-amino-4,6-dideoxygalactose transaminase
MNDARPLSTPPLIAMARPRFSEAAVERIARAVRSGMVASGPLVKELEAGLRAAFAQPHVVACGNGTAALHASLAALRVGAGHSVVTTALSFVATASSIVHAGATPLFCDVDDSLNLDPQKLDEALRAAKDAGRSPAAVIFVHLYGNPTNVADVAAVCDRHGVPLVEDCAQAIGARLADRPIAGFGRIAAFSFYATKNLAAGEGGAVVTGDAALAEHVSRFINHGRTSAYAHDLVGYNYRMTDLHAALALDQLEHLEALQARRTANAAALLAGLRRCEGVRFPRLAPQARHVYHQFTILVPADARDALARHLAGEQIQSAVVYPTPLPRLQCFAGSPQLPGASFAVAEQASHGCLSLPVHSDLGPAEMQRVTEAVVRFFESGAA